MGSNAVSDLPQGFKVVSESDIPEGFQIESHPGIDFGQAANAAGKALTNPSPIDMVQGGGNSALAAGQAALGSIYGQGKEALKKAVPNDIKESMGEGVASTFLPPIVRNLVPRLAKRAIGNAGVGAGIDAGTGFATEGINPVTEGLSKTASGVAEGAEENAGRLINQYIKPGKAQFSFGKTPGKEVVKQGITAWNNGDLKNKIGLKLNDLSSSLESIVGQHEAGGKTKVDMRPALQTISSKIQELSKLPETTGPAQEKLQAFGRDMLGLIGDNPEAVSPKNALGIKRLIGKIQSWSQKDPTFGTISDAARDMYHPIDSAMDTAMPETQPLNSSISNLIGAKTAMENGMAREQNKSFLGLFDRLGLTGLGGLLGFSHGGAPEAAAGAALGTGVTKLASSAFGRTNIAQALEGAAKTSAGASDVLSQIKGPQIVKKIIALLKDPEVTSTALQTVEKPPQNISGELNKPQTLLNRNRMSEIKSGAYLPQGTEGGTTIEVPGSSTINMGDTPGYTKTGNLPAIRQPGLQPKRPDQINMPELTDSDIAALAKKFGVPDRNIRSVINETDIPKGVGKAIDQEGLIQPKKIRNLIDGLLKRRKSNFGNGSK